MVENIKQAVRNFTSASNPPPEDHNNLVTELDQPTTWKGVLLRFAYEVILTGTTAYLSFLVLQKIGLGFGGPPVKREKDPRRNADAARKRLKAHSGTEVTFNQYENMIAGDMVFPDEIDVTFADVGGHDVDKREIYDLVCLPLKRPDIFAKTRSTLISPPRGILLYGPPGTGKTMMAKAIAKESGAAFINLKISTTMDYFVGESQKLVRAVFTLARKLSPCIIFIDEIDAFLRERKSTDHVVDSQMKAEFMALWDGIESDRDVNHEQFGIVVIGATNRPWDVDPAILRRMPRTFELSLPNLKDRENILRLVLKDENVDKRVNFRSLAQECQGYSGSDLKELCRAAATIPFREFASSVSHNQATPAEIRPITYEDFQLAKRAVRPSGEAAQQYHSKQTPPMGQNTPANAADNEAFLAGVQYGMTLAAAQQLRNGGNVTSENDVEPAEDVE